MSELKDFVYQTARTLPVILLLDTSGSMSENSKIDVMNSAVRDMLKNFKRFSNTVASISVAIITFGGTSAKVHLPITAMEELNLDAFQDMTANGSTPMGDAITKAKEIIEDKEQIPSRAYRPTVVLVSDGMPNDRWQQPLQQFSGEGRSAKCYRMAMGIGVGQSGTAYQVLKEFATDPEQVFGAEDAAEISKFFQYVTMSTTSRIRTANPNLIPTMDEVLAQPEAGGDSGDEEDFPF